MKKLSALLLTLIISVNAYANELVRAVIYSDGNLEAVKSIVSKGADINVVDYSNFQTPLSGAAHYGHLNIVKYLVENGANVDWTPCDYWPFAMSALMSASAKGHLEIVKYLISKGADINLTCGDSTALMYAGVFMRLSIVKYLVENGANINAVTNDRMTTLMLVAAQKTYDENKQTIIEYLISKGADTSIRSSKGYDYMDYLNRIDEED